MTVVLALRVFEGGVDVVVSAGIISLVVVLNGIGYGVIVVVVFQATGGPAVVVVVGDTFGG